MVHSSILCIFWKSHFVNINTNAFAWEHNATNAEWIKQNPNIDSAHIELIAEFEELQQDSFGNVLRGFLVNR